MSRLCVAMALCCVWVSVAEAQSGGGRRRWEDDALRPGAVGCDVANSPYICAEAPPVPQEYPNLLIDLPSGGRAVVVTPDHEVSLLRIPIDTPVRTDFGPHRFLRIAVFDHDDRKLLDRYIGRPAGRAYVSLRPGWDERLCQLVLRQWDGACQQRADRNTLELGLFAKRRDLDQTTEKLLARLEWLLGEQQRQRDDEAHHHADIAARERALAEAEARRVQEEAQRQAEAARRRVAPCGDREMHDLMSRLERTPFDDGKLEVITSFATQRYFTVAQVHQIAGNCTFGDGRLAAISHLAPKIVDGPDFYKLYDLCRFDSEKQSLKKIEGKLRPELWGAGGGR